MRKITKVVIGIVVIVGYVFLNLKMNAVYYAKHMPHKEGTYPELRVLVDNLFWISELDDGTFKYKNDGDSTINKTVDGKTAFYFSNSGYYEKKYYYHDIENNWFYVFDEKFNLIWLSKSREYENLLGKIEIDETQVKQQLYEFLKPIVDYQNKPLINLQWLFNWLYQEKLN